MAIRQISVFLENRKGSLENVMEVLAGAGVDLRAITIADTQEFGILRLIVRGHDTACRALRDAGYIISLNNVLAVEIPDEPGGLLRVLKTVASTGLDIEYSYAFLTPSDGKACVVLRVSDNDAAAEVLRSADIHVLTACEGDEAPL